MDEDRNFDPLVEGAYLIFSDPDIIMKDPDWELSLLVGRQPFEDSRQWRYDDDLDAIRGVVRMADFSLEVSASRKDLIDTEFFETAKEEEISNYIVDGSYALNSESVVGVYGIRRIHRQGSTDRPLFLGLYSTGMVGDRLAYWLDSGIVRGREEDRDLRGWGFDFLATYHFDNRLSPHLIFGYAFGSGDSNPENDTDGAFRQTGLHGNETEVSGAMEYLYYGEIFDPELSNMSILTLGAGASPRGGISIDLVYHYYVQDKLSDELRDSALDADPNGRSKRLGNEVDLILEIDELEDVRIRGFLGYFIPGRAFAPTRDDAFLARVEVEYEF